MTRSAGVPTTSHWGAYLVHRDVSAEGGIAVLPHPADPAPSPLLGNVAGALRHRTRVRRPAARRGWLDRVSQGLDPRPATRGREPFVELGWDEALDLLTAELARVRERHGNE